MADKKRTNQTLLNGALILSLASLVVKVIGVIYKIPLSNMIGTVGRGYFDSAYSLYVPIYTISMAGLPVAVSNMVSRAMALGNYRDVKIIHKVAKRLFLIVGIIIWVSGIASALVDNIPFAATMIPVIKTLSITSGIPLDTLSWSLAMGTDVGGSATPIGASANVVGTAIATKNGYPISWGEYCKVQAPATVIVIVISVVFSIMMVNFSAIFYILSTV